MNCAKHEIVVYRRTSPGRVEPFLARYEHKRWSGGQPDPTSLHLRVVRPLTWAEVYGGHVQWVADQVGGTRRKIRDARARRIEQRTARTSAA